MEFNDLLKFINGSFIKYGILIVYLISLIVGIILSGRKSNSESKQMVKGFLILAAALALEYLLPFVMHFKSSSVIYIIITMVIYAIRYSAIILAFKVFADYSPSNWIAIILTMMFIIYLFRTIYYSRVLYNYTAVISGMDDQTNFLALFFNNGHVLESVNVACLFIPAVILYIDGFMSVEKK